MSLWCWFFGHDWRSMSPVCHRATYTTEAGRRLMCRRCLIVSDDRCDDCKAKQEDERRALERQRQEDLERHTEQFNRSKQALETVVADAHEKTGRPRCDAYRVEHGEWSCFCGLHGNTDAVPGRLYVCGRFVNETGNEKHEWVSP